MTTSENPKIKEEDDISATISSLRKDIENGSGREGRGREDSFGKNRDTLSLTSSL